MKIKDIYNLAIDLGREKDPRSSEQINRQLQLINEEYEKLKEEDKEMFDKERLSNPYADTRVLHGPLEKEVKRILVGIDIGVEEILIADRLRDRKKEVDLVISHHPQGYALIKLYDVMQMQADILHKYGIPINIAEGILKERIGEVERRLLPLNYNRAVDAAKLLDVSFMCVHTPTDNLVTSYLQELLDKNITPLSRVSDIIKLLKTIPEYRFASEEGMLPKIIAGHEHNRVGRVLVDMTGGTEGSDKAAEKLANAGIGTLVEMHRTESFRKEAEKYYINVIIAGHIASDTLGINLFLDELEKIDKEIEILPISGFRRVSRLS